MNLLRVGCALCLLAAPALVAGQVPYRRILGAEGEPGHWLTYSGGYRAHRFSPLKQITLENAARLKPAWVCQIRGGGQFQTSPLVVDGVMYVTEPPTRVATLDALTGRPLWEFQTGGAVAANPVSFLIAGRQHVAIAAGQALFVFGLS